MLSVSETIQHQNWLGWAKDILRPIKGKRTPPFQDLNVEKKQLSTVAFLNQ